MPNKNTPSRRCLKELDIERELSQLVQSSEDEDSDHQIYDSLVADFYDDNFDNRLDNLQGISTNELYSILSESDTSLLQDHLPVQINQDVTMLDAGSAPQQSSASEHASHSLPSTSYLLPTSHIQEEPNNTGLTVQTSFSRDKFLALQNKSRAWTHAVSNTTYPKFEEQMKVKKMYNNRSQPLDYFLDFFPDNLIDIIVQNTNLYAAHTHSKSWRDVSREEIKAYFGMIVLMSINPLADLNNYWSTDEFYKNPVISRVMPIKRFKKITENLHISNITTEALRTSPDYDKLAKVRPAIEILNKTFKDNVEVSEFNSIDESMIRFKGRSHMKQYMPKKPIKRGYKCWARADSTTGYLYEFQFYTGKVNTGTQEQLEARVVMDLCESVPKNTLVAFDNFFTSLPLLEILQEKGIYSVGTIRQNRKGLPDVIMGKNMDRLQKKETALSPGEFIYNIDGPVSVIKWKDTKDVVVATTAFDPRAVEVIKRKQKDGTKKAMYCPLSIKKYTEVMGGVDHFDHFRASYPLGRKSRKKNWHRLFWFLLEAATINAYIVYMTTHSERRNTHKEFRLRLGRGLIQ